MRRIVLLLCIVVPGLSGFVLADNHVNVTFDDLKLKLEIENELYIFFRASELFIENEKEKDELVITQDFKLYHGKTPIHLNEKQTELTQEYYELADCSFEMLHDIKDQGIEIGLDGAALGLKAIGRVFRLLSPHYDAEDLERDMESEGESLEKRGEELEKAADRFEETLDHLGDVYEEMLQSIPELQNIDWLPSEWNHDYDYEINSEPESENTEDY
ncbi:MAG: hypothetical protein U5R06_23020 [candidate division KSB1 bacterium]|nr:hypothetical protein [candidate division KSB1 bacterium]